MRVIKQRHENDCGVACLAMLLDRSYGDVAAVVRQLYPKFPPRGLNIAQSQQVAFEVSRTILVPVPKTKTYLLNHAEGILGMNGGHICSAGHWVVWKEGVIIEPWHEVHAVFGLEEYLKMNKCRTATLLVKEGR